MRLESPNVTMMRNARQVSRKRSPGVLLAGHHRPRSLPGDQSLPNAPAYPLVLAQHHPHWQTRLLITRFIFSKLDRD